MILEAKNLFKNFKGAQVKAVQDVSLAVLPGKTLGIVGESGSGKSTLAKLLLCLLSPDKGEIYFEGSNISGKHGKELKNFRQKTSAVFQDPYLSLDSRMKVADILREPFLAQGGIHRQELDGKIKELLRSVELSESYLFKFPREMSGGECQRVAIARAISTSPKLIICDEPVSSLDAIVQVQILNLFLKLQEETNVAYIFISHDLRVVRHMSDAILVMKEGRVCENSPSEEIFKDPKHPYTRLLIENLR